MPAARFRATATTARRGAVPRRRARSPSSCSRSSKSWASTSPPMAAGIRPARTCPRSSNEVLAARRLWPGEARALDVHARAFAGASGLVAAPLPARLPLDLKELGDALEQRRNAEGQDRLPALLLGTGVVEDGDVADHIAR